MALNKLVYKSRTEEELLDALQSILNALWGRRHNGHVWTIPADELRDADCILVDGINELVKLREEVATLKAALELAKRPSGQG